jgi:membrane protein DedA with SNARE-associated domain
MDISFAEISHYFTAEAEHLEPVLLKYGVFIVIAAVAVEGFGIPAPGQTFMIAAAILSVRGDMNIVTVAIAAWTAAVAGSLLGYLIGRVGGRRLLQKLPLSERRLERMETLCQRHGNLFVVASRFFDGFRQFAGILMGSLNMPASQFAIMTALGAALWVGFWGIGVYTLDQHAHAMAAVLRQASPYTWAAAGILIAALLVYLFGGRRRAG